MIDAGREGIDITLLDFDVVIEFLDKLLLTFIVNIDSNF